MAPSAADDMYGRDGRTAVLDLHGTSLLFALNEKKFLLEKQKLCQAPTTRKIKDLAQWRTEFHAQKHGVPWRPCTKDDPPCPAGLGYSLVMQGHLLPEMAMRPRPRPDRE
jgi:hypothetical protein